MPPKGYLSARTTRTNLKTSSSTKSKEKKEPKSILSFFKAPVEPKQKGTQIATRQLDSGKHLISTTKISTSKSDGSIRFVNAGTSTGQRPAGTIISKKEEGRFISAGSSRTMQGGEAGPRGTRFVNAGKNFTDFMAKPSVVKSGPPVKNTLVKKPVVQNIVKSGPSSKNTRVNNTKTTATSVKRKIEDPILLRTRKAVGGDESLILNQRKFLQSKIDGSIRKDKPSVTARSLITLNKVKAGLKKGRLGHGIKNKYPVNYPSTRLPKVQDLTGIGPKNFNKKPTKKISLMSKLKNMFKSSYTFNKKVTEGLSLGMGPNILAQNIAKADAKINPSTYEDKKVFDNFSGSKNNPSKVPASLTRALRLANTRELQAYLVPNVFNDYSKAEKKAIKAEFNKRQGNTFSGTRNLIKGGLMGAL